jgi:hypothetical protein
MTHKEIIVAWNAQADHMNKWDALGEDEKLEWAMKVEREACVKECKKLIKVFLSSKYSAGQPLSSFKERHAVAACIEAIQARGQA